MICANMATTVVNKFGQSAAHALAAFGDFWRFFGRTLMWMGSGWWRWRNIREVFPLMYEVGTRSVPVISVTGAFIGMVLAVEAYTQFKTIGQEQRLGSIVSVSVVKQIGPVLTAVMLAGRIGGSLTAELGTMNVTEQLDALRVMGADPVRVLGGWLICVHSLGIPNQPFWEYARKGMDLWTINEGLVESIFFGGAIAMIACYKGFTTRAGASGVGRACTESFVASFLAIIIFNFFFAKVAEDWYIAQYGIRSLFGG